jgi:RNA polymerase sigma factor (sigma-70 family)
MELENAERVAAADSFSSGLFDEEIHQRLYTALSQLSAESAEVILLHYMQHKSIAEIASMLRVSRTVVGVRLFRARVRIRKLMRIGRREKL